MRLRWALAVALGVLVSPVLVGSSDAAPSDVVPGSDARAVALLDRAAVAESAVTYRGTQGVVELDHLPGLPQHLVDETLEVMHTAGEGTLLVQTGAAGQTRAGFADVSARQPALLMPLLQGSYRLAVGPRGEVADRAARTVEAVRPDGSVAARFWVDAATGLLLRRDLLDRSGATVASAGFRQLRLADSRPATDVDYLPPLLPSVSGGSVDDRALQAWEDRGWPCSQRLGAMTLYDARLVDDSGAALHLAYSDGLSTASVFVQRGTLDADGLPGARPAVVADQPVLVLDGHPRSLFWTADGYVVTVVSDAPAEDLAEVVAALPRPDAPATGWSRVERGLARVVSWVNPFD